MKKHFFLLLALGCSEIAFGQQFAIQGSISNLQEDRSIPCIPAELSFNGKPMITIENYDTGIEVYDEKFNLIETIKEQELEGERYLSSVRYERELMGVSAKKDTIMRVVEYNTSLAEFMEEQNMFTYDQGAKLFSVTIDGRECLTYLQNPMTLESNMYASEYYGNVYPIYYFTAEMVDGTDCVTQHIRAYQPEYGEWQKMEEIYTEEQLRTMTMYYYNLDRNDSGMRLLATQTLFNNDEGFEYLMPIWEHRDYLNISKTYTDAVISDVDVYYSDWVSESIETSRYANTATYLKGFSIRNSKGEELDRIMFADGWLGYDSGHYCSAITLGGNTYLVLRGYVPVEDDKYNEMTVFYRIDPGANSIKQVKQTVNYGITIDKHKITIGNVPAGLSVTARDSRGVLIDSSVSDGNAVSLQTQGGNIVLSIGQDSKVIRVTE